MIEITSIITSQIITILCYAVSLLVKANILITKSFKTSRRHKAGFFLFLALCCLVIVDASWMLWLTFGKNYVTTIITRFAWASCCFFYLLLFLLLESLLQKKYALQKRHIALITTTALFALFFIISVFFTINTTRFNSITINFYSVILLYKTCKILYELRFQPIPKILKKQLFILLTFFIAPSVVFDLLQSLSILLFYKFNFLDAVEFQSIFAFLSTLSMTIAIYYCFKKIFGLRFLNFKGHVQEEGNFNFIYDFKSTLAELGNAMNEPEVIHSTKSFFHKALNIPYAKTNLFIRNLNDPQQQVSTEKNSESSVENFITTHKDNHEISNLLQESKIFIYDEIAFSSFYEETEARTSVIKFLDSINADIFLPIYDKKIIVGYITVERNARGGELYTNVERDEMVVLASYLGNIIYLLQNKNLDAIILKEHALQAELYHKHQEINKYKESIRSFLRSAKERKIGLLFYKNRKFIFGNQTAHEFIDINLNTQEGHPLTKAFKSIARKVEDYKSPQSCLSKDTQGNRIVIAGLPNLEQNNIIFTIYYPEISDVIKEQIDQLKDPSEWDYVLYLETTQSGQLINKLIPGNGTTLLQFKINLLKAALNKKATLLEETEEEDLENIVTILHHVSLRQELHTLKLSSAHKNLDIAIKLFGINPIFGNTHGKSLLEQLNGTGTLFIQNIHFLDLETQGYLAEFIKYGFYRPLKSDARSYSDTQIICSTNQNLPTLVREGKFLESLYNELRTATLSMPSLLTLPDAEFMGLTHEYIEQATQTQTFKNFFELTEREMAKLSENRPLSFQDLKERIQTVLVQKSKKKHIYNETHFNPAYNITDPELAEAAKLGKNALRNEAIMGMLWSKFKNQNKIATFLGVNRSSVNRRCKDFNLS